MKTNLIFEYSEKIKNERTIESIHRHLMQEIGELTTEIQIELNEINKSKGPDGIIGESIDCILCLIDLIKKYKPDVSEEELNTITIEKLEKWKKSNV